MKKLAIVQSNYIPWRGYFELISYVDEFVIFDDMQYTKRDWRNRNRIKTPKGLEWLSIPVQVKGQLNQRIMDTHTQGDSWKQIHLSTIRHNYAKAAHFEEIMPWIQILYDEIQSTCLSEINLYLIREVCRYLDIRTPITSSLQYSTSTNPSDRLAQITDEAGAGVYVTGPAAKGYLDLEPFQNRSIQVEWFDYGGHRNYPQLWGEFEDKVSILDLILNCGGQSKELMRYLK